MKVISDEYFEAHLSNDFYNPIYNTEDHRLLEAKSIAGHILKDPNYWMVYQSSVFALNTEKIYLLWAHGVGKKDSSEYWYQDEDNLFKVQEWVNDKDGLGAVLIIFTCNVIGATLFSRKSPIFYPTSELSYNDIIEGKNIQMFIPR